MTGGFDSDEHIGKDKQEKQKQLEKNLAKTMEMFDKGTLDMAEIVSAAGAEKKQA